MPGRPRLGAARLPVSVTPAAWRADRLDDAVVTGEERRGHQSRRAPPPRQPPMRSRRARRSGQSRARSRAPTDRASPSKGVSPGICVATQSVAPSLVGPHLDHPTEMKASWCRASSNRDAVKTGTNRRSELDESGRAGPGSGRSRCRRSNSSPLRDERDRWRAGTSASISAPSLVS
jgi:hypothetical protein